MLVLNLPRGLLFEDNHVAICLAHYGHFKEDTASIWICAGNLSKTDLINDVLKLVPIASENMIADIGTAARPAPALKIASATIYGELASHQSVTLPI